MNTVKKILLIDDRLSKSSYTLRTLVGFYLIYIDYNIWSGLREPDVAGVGLVVAGGVFFAVMSVLCILSGAYGLYFKEYREEKENREASEERENPQDGEEIEEPSKEERSEEQSE